MAFTKQSPAASTLIFSTNWDTPIAGQPAGSSPSLTTDAVEEDEAEDDETSAVSFPHSDNIFFRHDWHIASKSS